jgi:hypothetical protein
MSESDDFSDSESEYDSEFESESESESESEMNSKSISESETKSIPELDILKEKKMLITSLLNEEWEEIDSMNSDDCINSKNISFVIL